MTSDSSAIATEAVRWLGDPASTVARAMEESLAALVNENSFTENVEGGRATGKLLRELFTIDGLSGRVVSSKTFADHLVFASRGRPGRAPVALVGHLDTVFPPGTFEGYRRDGDRRRGPGVLDMKGGLVVVAYAIRALARVGSLDSIGPLRVVIVSDEEVGSPEGADVIRTSIDGADACLVFESGRASDAIITRRKGTGMMKVVAHGKAAHAGNAHREGGNAIWALARFIDKAQGLTDYDRGVTVNVGKITGGQSKNTVPDYAEALVDLRFCTVEDARDLVSQIHRVAREASVDIPETRLDVDGGVARLPLERSDASGRLMEAYGSCARAVGLGGGEAPLIGGGSDASTSAAMGIASIDGLGPRGEGFHTVHEYIDAPTLVTKAMALALFLGAR